MLYGTDEQFSVKDYLSQKPKWVWFCIFLLVICGILIGFFGIYQLVSTNDQEIVTSNDIDNQVCERTADFGQITVYISGAVINPGVYILESGDRVADLLESAGGISQNSDKSYVNKQINLAKKLSDGEQLYIPTVTELEAEYVSQINNSEDLSNDTRPISINSSTKDELMKLSGIGEVRASKIIENRPYSAVNEMVEKGVLSQSLIDEIVDEIKL